VDHPDGLFDPAGYFEMLQALAARAWNIKVNGNGAPPPRPLYVVAEKILSDGEQLPHRWAVHGTTGYNYLNDLNGLFVNPLHARRMRRTYAKLTGHVEAFEDVTYASKHLIMDTAMASEMSVLANLLNRIGKNNRRSRDFTLESLRRHRGSGRVLPGVSHLRGRPRLDHGRSVDRRAGDHACQAAEPGDGSLPVRFLPRGHAAARAGRGRPPAG
jgi:hypothetical protein